MMMVEMIIMPESKHYFLWEVVPNKDYSCAEPAIAGAPVFQPQLGALWGQPKRMSRLQSGHQL